MVFEINAAFLENLSELIVSNNHREITTLFSEVHFADIAEVLEEVDFDEAIYIIKLLDIEKTSEGHGVCSDERGSAPATPHARAVGPDRAQRHAKRQELGGNSQPNVDARR